MRRETEICYVFVKAFEAEERELSRWKCCASKAMKGVIKTFIAYCPFLHGALHVANEQRAGPGSFFVFGRLASA